MSLVVFPFKQEDPRVALANVRTAAAQERVREVLCVGSDRDTAYAAIEEAAPEIERKTGTPVRLILQRRIGTLRPGKGDAMNTGLAWFVEHTRHERIHFYDADITSFGGDWISKAEAAADRGFPVVRHYYPRAATDAMITWFITRVGFALLWPDSVLPHIEQPLGGELLLTREVAAQLVADTGVKTQSDWGIDTRLTMAIVADGHALCEIYMPQGKLHKLYGSLTDIKDMTVECFGVIQAHRALEIPAGSGHVVEPPTGVDEEVRRKVAYSIEDTVGLLREGWTDAQLSLLDLFPPEFRQGMAAGRDYPRLGFLDAPLWGDVYPVFLQHADPTDDAWRELLFRAWVSRVLTYTVTEAIRGYDAAMDYLRSTIAGYMS